MAKAPATEVMEPDHLMEAMEERRGQIARLPEGGQLVSERTLFGDVFMAQPTKAPRDEAKTLRRIDVMAGAAGEDWYYRYPVKNRRTGETNWIEGPSIECAMDVANYYGNCRVDSAIVDGPPGYWTIHSRFIDLETGFTLIRPFIQSKQGSRLGGEDDDRRIQIAFSIGTSKSQRNVVTRALRLLTKRAFEGAKKNLVERIGKQLPQYRQRAIERINDLGEGLLGRVERVYGRKAGEWLAPDLARVIAELRAIADGMASIDETWPPPAPAEPRRSDVTDVAPTTAPLTATPSAAQPEGTAAPTAAEAGAGAPQHHSGPPEGPHTEPPTAEVSGPRTNWRLPDNLLGQDAVLKALHELLEMIETHAELDLFESQNAERIGKITGTRGAELRNASRARREQRGPTPS
jgi:hypothetical protein